MTVYDLAKKCMKDEEFNRGGIIKNERKYLDAVGFAYKVDGGVVVECGDDAHEFYEAMCTLAKLNQKYSERK